MYIIYGTPNHIKWYIDSRDNNDEFILYSNKLDLKSLNLSHCVIASDPTKYISLRSEFIAIYQSEGCVGDLNITHSYFENYHLFGYFHRYLNFLQAF